MPTIEEIRHESNGAKHFSKIDLKNAYHQLELSPESRSITTFATYIGLRRNTRLNFGTCSATEVFHEKLIMKIADIRNCINIYDDILVYGKSHTGHDRALKMLLDRLKKLGITANIDKCIFNKHIIDFYAMRFSQHGMGADPMKIEAIKMAEPPANVSELKSFLGMTNYSSQFIKTYSSKMAKLRELLVENKKWEWNHEHRACFDELKLSLQGSNVLGCFDVNASTKIITSPTGLEAMLVQTQRPGKEKVIAYASRSLNSAEKNYN